MIFYTGGRGMVQKRKKKEREKDLFKRRRRCRRCCSPRRQQRQQKLLRSPPSLRRACSGRRHLRKNSAAPASGASARSSGWKRWVFFRRFGFFFVRGENEEKKGLLFSLDLCFSSSSSFSPPSSPALCDRLGPADEFARVAHPAAVERRLCC